MSRRKKTIVLTVACIKGGTGKTATAGSLAQAAALDGKHTLAVDLDPQANLSLWQRADFTGPGSYEAITGGATAAEAVQHTQGGVDLIAGGANLAGLRTAPRSGRRLEQALASILPKYDLVIIDTGPQAGEAQYNALLASNSLLIPLETDSNGLQGLYQITDIAKHIQASNPDLRILGTVLTRYDPRPKLNRYLRETIKERGAEAGAPLLTEIRQSISLREAMALQRPLFEYAPNSKPAQDYITLYKLIAQKMQEV